MLKKRTLALLLSLAMLLTFMPAMAFADDNADAADQPEAVSAEEAAVDAAEEAVVEEAAEEAAEPQEAVDAAEDEESAEAEPVPVSLKYSGPEITYEPGEEPGSVDLYQEGMTFIITYDDNTTKTAECKTWTTEKNEDGESYDINDYFFDEPIVKTDSDGDKYPENALWFEFDRDDATKSSVPVRFIYDGENEVKGTVPVAEKVYPKPTKIEFVPAGDFVVEGLIGDDTLFTYDFYGEGNKFVVTYEENGKSFVKEQVFYEDGDDSGFRASEDEDEFWTDIHLNTRIAQGTNEYAGEASVDSAYGEIKLPIKVKVSAEMYSAYVEYKTYSYTGKNIKPKVVVKYFDGKKYKKMPAKWYTCKPKKYKAIGAHNFEVKIKKKYQAKYGASLWGYWEILPKTPAIKKATVSKNSVTVTWGKFSKKAQKGIDGFYVQLSDDKSFNFWSREVEAKKGDSKAVLTDLDPGIYYVRVISHKAVGKGDGSPWESKPSKVKKVEVK